MTTDLNKIAEDFAKKTLHNKIETIEYYIEIRDMREYSILQPFKKLIDNLFFSFCLNNGLWNRIKEFELFSSISDEDKALLMLWTKNSLFSDNIPKNRYYQGILKWYFDRLDYKIEDLSFDDITIPNKKNEEIKIAHKLYSKIPAMYLKLNNSSIPSNISKISNSPLIQHIPDYIKIGKSIQFNVKGFPMNETLYLLCGMAIVHALDFISQKHTFRELINLLRSYIQLNIKSLCLLPDFKDSEKYNLTTFLKLEKDKYNYRYKCAEKYFKDFENSNPQNTKYCISDEGKTFLLTEYSETEYNKVWDELEEMYSKNKLTDELIVKWFDGQLLTRSTCLIGCLLIVLKEQKAIRFLENEMPDWKAIGQNTIQSTYTISEDKIDSTIPHPKKLSDVLDVLAIYISNSFQKI